MLAVFFTGGGNIELREVPTPEPKPGEALIEVGASGLCGSELKAYRSPEGADGIPGHEVTGRVADANATKRLRVGDRVAINVMIGCGECYFCLKGEPKFCPKLRVQLGGHAEFVAVSEACCLPLPDDIPYDIGVLLGGDTIGVAHRTCRRMSVRAGEFAVVFGAGPVGLGMITVLKFWGARVMAAEIVPYRRRLAKRIGADWVIDPTREDIVGMVKGVGGGFGADLAIDCSGRPEAEVWALSCARPEGRVAFVGENREVKVSPSDHFIRKELTVIGSWYFSSADYFEILNSYRRGLKVNRLITHRFKIRDADKAFKTFASSRTGKVIIAKSGR
ncbi:MAG: zinc-dependent alcohol dehydrogenase [bacterium]